MNELGTTIPADDAIALATMQGHDIMGKNRSGLQFCAKCFASLTFAGPGVLANSTAIQQECHFRTGREAWSNPRGVFGSNGT